MAVGGGAAMRQQSHNISNMAKQKKKISLHLLKDNPREQDAAKIKTCSWLSKVWEYFR